MQLEEAVLASLGDTRWATSFDVLYNVRALKRDPDISLIEVRSLLGELTTEGKVEMLVSGKQGPSLWRLGRVIKEARA